MGKDMIYRDTCGAYDRSSNNFNIVTVDPDEKTIKFERTKLETHISGPNQLKLWTKYTCSLTDSSFKRRIYQIIEHPIDFDCYNLKNKAQVEYVGKFAVGLHSSLISNKIVF